MDGRQVETSVPYAGHQQMQALAAATLHALERAGLLDAVDEVNRRVLTRERADICDVSQLEGEAPHIAYKPMIELLLHEIKHVARAPHVSAEDRRVRIEWAMTLAGV